MSSKPAIHTSVYVSLVFPNIYRNKYATRVLYIHERRCNVSKIRSELLSEARQMDKLTAVNWQVVVGKGN